MKMLIAPSLIGLLLPLASSVAIGAADGPAAVYTLHCSGCHGPDGKARTPIGRKFDVKDLSLSRVDDTGIARQISEGRKDEKGRERMPAFKSRLSPEQIQSLVPLVKGFRQ